MELYEEQRLYSEADINEEFGTAFDSLEAFTDPNDPRPFRKIKNYVVIAEKKDTVVMMSLGEMNKKIGRWMKFYCYGLLLPAEESSEADPVLLQLRVKQFTVDLNELMAGVWIETAKLNNIGAWYKLVEPHEVYFPIAKHFLQQVDLIVRVAHALDQDETKMCKFTPNELFKQGRGLDPTEYEFFEQNARFMKEQGLLAGFPKNSVFCREMMKLAREAPKHEGFPGVPLPTSYTPKKADGNKASALSEDNAKLSQSKNTQSHSPEVKETGNKPEEESTSAEGESSSLPPPSSNNEQTSSTLEDTTVSEESVSPKKKRGRPKKNANQTPPNARGRPQRTPAPKTTPSRKAKTAAAAPPAKKSPPAKRGGAASARKTPARKSAPAKKAAPVKKSTPARKSAAARKAARSTKSSPARRGALAKKTPAGRKTPGRRGRKKSAAADGETGVASIGTKEELPPAMIMLKKEAQISSAEGTTSEVDKVTPKEETSENSNVEEEAPVVKTETASDATEGKGDRMSGVDDEYTQSEVDKATVTVSQDEEAALLEVKEPIEKDSDVQKVGVPIATEDLTNAQEVLSETGPAVNQEKDVDEQADSALMISSQDSTQRMQIDTNFGGGPLQTQAAAGGHEIQETTEGTQLGESGPEELLGVIVLPEAVSEEVDAAPSDDIANDGGTMTMVIDCYLKETLDESLVPMVLDMIVESISENSSLARLIEMKGFEILCGWLYRAIEKVSEDKAALVTVAAPYVRIFQVLTASGQLAQGRVESAGARLLVEAIASAAAGLLEVQDEGQGPTPAENVEGQANDLREVQDYTSFLLEQWAPQIPEPLVDLATFAPEIDVNDAFLEEVAHLDSMEGMAKFIQRYRKNMPNSLDVALHALSLLFDKTKIDTSRFLDDGGPTMLLNWVKELSEKMCQATHSLSPPDKLLAVCEGAMAAMARLVVPAMSDHPPPLHIKELQTLLLNVPEACGAVMSAGGEKAQVDQVLDATGNLQYLLKLVEEGSKDQMEAAKADVPEQNLKGPAVEETTNQVPAPAPPPEDPCPTADAKPAPRPTDEKTTNQAPAPEPPSKDPCPTADAKPAPPMRRKTRKAAQVPSAGALPSESVASAESKDVTTPVTQTKKAEQIALPVETTASKPVETTASKPVETTAFKPAETTASKPAPSAEAKPTAKGRRKTRKAEQGTSAETALPEPAPPADTKPAPKGRRKTRKSEQSISSETALPEPAPSADTKPAPRGRRRTKKAEQAAAAETTSSEITPPPDTKPAPRGKRKPTMSDDESAETAPSEPVPLADSKPSPKGRRKTKKSEQEPPAKIETPSEPAPVTSDPAPLPDTKSSPTSTSSSKPVQETDLALPTTESELSTDTTETSGFKGILVLADVKLNATEKEFSKGLAAANSGAFVMKILSKKKNYPVTKMKWAADLVSSSNDEALGTLLKQGAGQAFLEWLLSLLSKSLATKNRLRLKSLSVYESILSALSCLQVMSPTPIFPKAEQAKLSGLLQLKDRLPANLADSKEQEEVWRMIHTGVASLAPDIPMEPLPASEIPEAPTAASNMEDKDESKENSQKDKEEFVPPSLLSSLEVAPMACPKKDWMEEAGIADKVGKAYDWADDKESMRRVTAYSLYDHKTKAPASLEDLEKVDAMFCRGYLVPAPVKGKKKEAKMLPLELKVNVWALDRSPGLKGIWIQSPTMVWYGLVQPDKSYLPVISPFLKKVEFVMFLSKALQLHGSGLTPDELWARAPALSARYPLSFATANVAFLRNHALAPEDANSPFAQGLSKLVPLPAESDTTSEKESESTSVLGSGFSMSAISQSSVEVKSDSLSGAPTKDKDAEGKGQHQGGVAAAAIRPKDGHHVQNEKYKTPEKDEKAAKKIKHHHKDSEKKKPAHPHHLFVRMSVGNLEELVSRMKTGKLDLAKRMETLKTLWDLEDEYLLRKFMLKGGFEVLSEWLQKGFEELKSSGGAKAGFRLVSAIVKVTDKLPVTVAQLTQAARFSPAKQLRDLAEYCKQKAEIPKYADLMKWCKTLRRKWKEMAQREAAMQAAHPEVVPEPFVSSAKPKKPSAAATGTDKFTPPKPHPGMSKKRKDKHSIGKEAPLVKKKKTVNAHINPFKAAASPQSAVSPEDSKSPPSNTQRNDILNSVAKPAKRQTGNDTLSKLIGASKVSEKKQGSLKPDYIRRMEIKKKNRLRLADPELDKALELQDQPQSPTGNVSVISSLAHLKKPAPVVKGFDETHRVREPKVTFAPPDKLTNYMIVKPEYQYYMEDPNFQSWQDHLSPVAKSFADGKGEGQFLRDILLSSQFSDDEDDEDGQYATFLLMKKRALDSQREALQNQNTIHQGHLHIDDDFELAVDSLEGSDPHPPTSLDLYPRPAPSVDNQMFYPPPRTLSFNQGPRFAPPRAPTLPIHPSHQGQPRSHFSPAKVPPGPPPRLNPAKLPPRMLPRPRPADSNFVSGGFPRPMPRDFNPRSRPPPGPPPRQGPSLSGFPPRQGPPRPFGLPPQPPRAFPPRHQNMFPPPPPPPRPPILHTPRHQGPPDVSRIKNQQQQDQKFKHQKLEQSSLPSSLSLRVGDEEGFIEEMEEERPPGVANVGGSPTLGSQLRQKVMQKKEKRKNLI